MAAPGWCPTDVYGHGPSCEYYERVCGPVWGAWANGVHMGCVRCSGPGCRAVALPPLLAQEGSALELHGQRRAGVVKSTGYFLKHLGPGLPPTRHLRRCQSPVCPSTATSLSFVSGVQLPSHAALTLRGRLQTCPRSASLH